MSGRNRPKGSVDKHSTSLSPSSSNLSSASSSQRNSFASLSHVSTGDHGGLVFYNNILAGQYFSWIQLSKITQSLWDKSRLSAEIVLELPFSVDESTKPSVTSIDESTKPSVTSIDDEQKLPVCNTFLQVSLPSLPYKSEDIPLYILDTVGDAWRFQLLLVARWVQQVLANDESSVEPDKLLISASQMQSSGKIYFSWETDSKQTSKMISLQDEEGMLAYSFIPAMLGLFTLSRSELIEYCNENIRQETQSEIDKTKEIKKLFSRVSQGLRLKDLMQEVEAEVEEKEGKRKYLSEEIRGEVDETKGPEKTFVQDHFFNELEKHKNILELIRNIDTILDEIFTKYKASLDETSADETSSDKPLVNFLRALFLSMVGSYFAVLPAVKDREEFIKKYQLERDFKLVKDADGSFSREYTQQEEIADESSSSICSRLMNSAVGCFCCFFRCRERQESTREDQELSSEVGNNPTV